jgi:hypothetical protein
MLPDVGPRRSSRAVVVVLIISFAVPPMLTVVNAAADSRAESATISVATTLAQGVMERILADVYAGEEAPGFHALDDADAYLNTPGSGLYERLAWLIEPYEARGITYTVEVGAPIGPEGFATGDPAADLYRQIDVVVQVPGATGSFDLRLASIVGEAP